MLARPWVKPAASATVVKVDPMAALIDELGHINGQISPLEKRAKELKEQIGALGAGEHKGTKCIAAITVADRTTLDGKSLAEDMPEVAARYQKTSSVTTIRIKALV